MSKVEDKIKGDEVEQLVCIPIDMGERLPMSKDISGILIHAMLMKKVSVKDLDVKKVKGMPAQIQMGIQRLDAYEYDMELSVMIMIGMLGESIGGMVLYITYLQWKIKEKGIDVVTLDQFCEWFGDGFPGKEFMHEIWKAQKCKGQPDNLVDRRDACESIFEEIIGEPEEKTGED